MLPMNTRLRNPRRSLVSSPISVPVGSYQPWSPLTLQPRLWLDASDLTTITESGGAVSEWRDKSSNGYAFTQATSTAQPTTGSTTQNGLNVLSFDGGDSLVATSAASTWKFLHDGTQYLVGLVARRDTAGVNGTVVGTFAGGSTIGASIRWLAADTFSHLVAGGIVSNTPTAGTSTATRLVSILAKPSDSTAANRSSMWIDGGTEQRSNTSTGTPSTADPTYTLWIGNRAGAALPLTGMIAELVIVTGTNVTNFSRQILHDYLNRKWAVY